MKLNMWSRRAGTNPGARAAWGVTNCGEPCPRCGLAGAGAGVAARATTTRRISPSGYRYQRSLGLPRRICKRSVSCGLPSSIGVPRVLTCNVAGHRRFVNADTGRCRRPSTGRPCPTLAFAAAAAGSEWALEGCSPASAGREAVCLVAWDRTPPPRERLRLRARAAASTTGVSGS